MDPVTAIAQALSSVSTAVGSIVSSRNQRLAQDDINLGRAIHAQAEEERIRASQQNTILILLTAMLIALIIVFVLKKRN
ncbi:MAG: hypothetical protein MRZ79_12550 [Bacteroidia bacterium]|nr:hypothetical protein [Bacteroidia bacterium]